VRAGGDITGELLQRGVGSRLDTFVLGAELEVDVRRLLFVAGKSRGDRLSLLGGDVQHLAGAVGRGEFGFGDALQHVLAQRV
jgi:hypothetical protein